jgi:hypothetical protein
MGRILTDGARPESMPSRPPPRPQSLRTGHLRREIAALAARMMAEDGIRDFGFAKRKAAKQLGAVDTESLPNNAEIEAELRAYQALFQDEEHANRLYELRRAAVSVMRLLEPFRPYLTGAVLDGTAGRYAEVELDLFPESAKEVEIFFLNQDIRYELREPRRPGPDAPEAYLSFDWEDTPVHAAVFSNQAERHARRGGRAQERARLSAVEALVREMEAETGE